ncbi:MAG: saccharopine dehydrogenase NADP-binding domain-containing protein [Sandaracinaceae bacterium]|nr:saccharopine dehydrogenase NADP-binding domain-containing protein [Sandaracinaceae bacterium]
MSDRQYDIVAFGATGFTGGLAAEYLAANAPPGTRWAVAGRRQDALRDVTDRLAAAPCPPSGTVVARVDDPASVRAMTGATRVLLTTVGPFEEHGEPVVRACVETATDYLDITGEPRFVDRMIDRYHADAERAAIKIVSCCGFDSIPHDLGVLFTLTHLPHDVPITIEGFVRSRGTFSGGTWHSAVRAMGELRAYAAERRAREKESAPAGRRVRGVRPRVHYERRLRAWAAPLPTIDPQVVLRSARLCEEYGPDFRYGHYARVKNLSTIVGAGVAIGGIVALAQLPPTRALLFKVKDRGDGPSAEQRAKAWFTVTFLAEGGGERVTTEVAGGDPGYSETAKMLSESALCLALERERTPARYGVITPAAAMGLPLVERLQRAGISFRRVD